MFFYLNNFFIFSVFGYIFETLFFFIFHINKKSGFLYLGWTPFYGIGVILISIIYKYINKKNYDSKKKNIILFFIYFFLLSLLEFLGGVLLKFLFGHNLWNYKKILLNIGPHISVITSLVWTLFAFLYLYKIKKYSDKIAKNFPKFFTILLLITFIIDNILTIYNVLNSR